MRSIILASLVALAVAGCDERKPRGPLPPEGLPPPGPREAAAAAAPASPSTPAVKLDANGATTAPLPPPPAWARPLIGQVLGAAFPKTANACIGNTDVVTARFQGTPRGVRVLGWAWEPTAKAPVKRVLLADEAGRIVAAAETGAPRADVAAARSDITSPDTGWLADAPKTSGQVTGWAILADGRTICPLGHLNL